MSPSPPLLRLSQNPTIRGMALFLITLAVFLPAMNGAFIWDDDITLTNNPLVKLPFGEGFRDIWLSPHATDYYPLTWSTFWVEWRIFGLNLTGYQAINVVLHSLSAVLLWRILHRLGLPGGSATAWCAALLFAVHPVAVDSVAWISQRKNTLSMVFYLLAILGFLKFDDSEGRRFYWLSPLAFLAALLSKASVITFPIILLVLLWYRHGDSYLAALWSNPFPSKKRPPSVFEHKLVQLLPALCLSAASALVTIWFQGKVIGYGATSGFEVTDTISKTLRASFEETGNSPALGERILLTGQVYWFYFCKLIVPTKIAMVYATWKINAHHWAHYIPVLAMIAGITATFCYQKRLGRGPCAALAYIFLALLPVLGLVKMSYHAYSWAANHLSYLAIPGVTALGASLAAHFPRKVPHPASRFTSRIAILIIFAIFAATTWHRASLYKEPSTLWSDNIAKIPTAYVAYNETRHRLSQRGKVRGGSIPI